MGIESFKGTTTGMSTLPTTKAKWQSWVSATATRNFVAKNTLVDWLELYGKERGFKQDTEFPNYDPSTNFTDFILKQGHAFEEAVTRYIATLGLINTISHSPSQIRILGKAKETIQALVDGHPVIGQAVRWDAESMTYGAQDFPIRSDVLNDLFLGTLSSGEERVSAPDINADGYHYIVVDVKFTTMDLLANGEVWAMEVQLQSTKSSCSSITARWDDYRATARRVLSSWAEAGGRIRERIPCEEAAAWSILAP